MATMELKLGKAVVILGGDYAGCNAWIKPSKKAVESKAMLIIEITDEDGEKDLHVATINRTHFKLVSDLTTYETFLLQSPATLKLMRDAAQKVAQSNVVSLQNYTGIGLLFEAMVEEKLRHARGFFTRIDRSPAKKGNKKGKKHGIDEDKDDHPMT